MRPWIGCVGVVIAALACESPIAPEAVGAWGGTSASLTLSRAGGTVQYQCGAGSIAPGWRLSESGVFAATGQHFFGGGPVPIGGRPPHPAEYSGTIIGNVFVLTVTVTDVPATLGPFRLERDGPIVTELCD